MLRSMPLDQLVSTLVSEHAKIKSGLVEARHALDAKEYARAKEALAEVERTFRQHIVDEEGQILRILIEVYGREGAESAIAVFRQHRPINALMEAVGRFASLSPEELSRNEDELLELLDDHTMAEESRVFPAVLSARGLSSR